MSGPPSLQPAPQPGLDVAFYAAPEPLAECIATIYRLTVDLPAGETVSDLLLPEWANLRFFTDIAPDQLAIGGRPAARSSFFATGPTSRALPLTVGKVQLWGVGLLPLGWAHLVRAPASEMADQAVNGAAHPAFAHLGGIAAALEEAGDDASAGYRRLVEGLAAHARPPREESRIRAVQRAMFDPYLVQIPDFAERAGVSVRTLERVCARYFGFSPNVLLRRQRLIRSLAAFINDGEARWSEAIDRHYHDQPHFVREFHHFMGMSPREYASRPHPIMRAFMPHRQEVWGSPARGREPRGGGGC